MSIYRNWNILLGWWKKHVEIVTFVFRTLVLIEGSVWRWILDGKRFHRFSTLHVNLITHLSSKKVKANNKWAAPLCWLERKEHSSVSPRALDFCDRWSELLCIVVIFRRGSINFYRLTWWAVYIASLPDVTRRTWLPRALRGSSSMCRALRQLLEDDEDVPNVVLSNRGGREGRRECLCRIVDCPPPYSRMPPVKLRIFT